MTAAAPERTSGRPSSRASAAFAAALVARPEAERPAGLLGLEHEYVVRGGAGPVDFSRLIHRLPLDGARVDPADPNAFRCRWGGVLTADGAEAEVATPPVRRRPGFTRALDRWAETGRHALEGVLPGRLELEGGSTHLNVQMPNELNARACRLYANAFAAPLMLLMDRTDSPGLLIRPRLGRMELGAEFVAGSRLRAAAAFAAGSARACAHAIATGRTDVLPPLLAVDVEPGYERYGWYVDRVGAFAKDLCLDGRTTRLRLADGRTINAQTHLELAWLAARDALGRSAAPEDLAAADAIVAGARPLPCEQADWHEPTSLRRIGSSSYGAILLERARPGFSVSLALATWDYSIFALSSGGQRAYACVPRCALTSFLRLLDEGGLDTEIEAYFDATTGDRVLEVHAQTAFPALWDAIGPPRQLAPPERNVAGLFEVFVPPPPARAEATEPAESETEDEAGAADPFLGAATPLVQTEVAYVDELSWGDRPGKPLVPLAEIPPGGWRRLPWIVFVVLLLFSGSAIGGITYTLLTGGGGHYHLAVTLPRGVTPELVSPPVHSGVFKPPTHGKQAQPAAETPSTPAPATTTTETPAQPQPSAGQPQEASVQTSTPSPSQPPAKPATPPPAAPPAQPPLPAFFGVTIHLDGGGAVTSDPAGLTCAGDTCTGEFPPGTVVTFTPADGGTFVGGPCDGTATCTVDVGAPVDLTVAFRFPLTVTITGDGTGSVSGAPANPIAGGTTVALTATPADGSTFGGWSGACAGTGTGCTVTMDGPKSVTARFDHIPATPGGGGGGGTPPPPPPPPVPTATVTITVVNPGTVTLIPGGTCTSTCSTTVPLGDPLTIDAPGASIGGDCTSTTGVCTYTPTATSTVTITFPAPVLVDLGLTIGGGPGTVTISPGGTPCTSSCTRPVAVGTPVTLTGSGATFTGACTGTGSCTFTPTAATVVTVTFPVVPTTTSLTLTLTGTGTVTVNPGGTTCSSSCTATVPIGSPVTLTGTGAAFTGVCTGSGSCTFTPSGPASETATFPAAPATEEVDVFTSGSGTVTINPGGTTCAVSFCNVSVPVGSTVTVTTTPAGAITGDCTSFGTGVCTYTPSGVSSVQVDFPPFRLTLTKLGSGSGTVGGAAFGSTDFPGGTVVTLTPSPSPGSIFSGFGGACSGTAPCSLTMNQPRFVTATFTVVPVEVFGSITGTGTVGGSGLSCGGGGCSVEVPPGTSVTFTATPTPPATTVTWGGDFAACGTATSCTRTISAFTTFTVTFS